MPPGRQEVQMEKNFRVSSVTEMNREAYEDFGRRAFKAVKECIREGLFDYDAELLAELAVHAGLMVHEPYDPAKHNLDFYDHTYEPGDWIYY